jgi:hypothetical protein
MKIHVTPFPELLPAAEPLALLPIAAAISAAIVAASAVLLWSL